MLRTHRGTGSRVLAHWAAVILGVVMGLVLLGIGLPALFVITSHGTAIGILAVVAGTLPLLPLSVLGIFKPRGAACGVITTCAVCVVSLLLASVFSFGWAGYSASAVRRLVLLFLPPVGVAGLLWDASSGGAAGPRSARASREPTDASAKHPSTFAAKRWLTAELVSPLRAGSRAALARWAAVVLGILAGGRTFRLGLILLSKSIHVGGWLGAAGSGATFVALLPLSILAIFRPRAAAYGALLSLAVVLAYPAILFHPPQYGIGEMLGGMLLYLLPSVPLALVTALLLYASVRRQPKPGYRGPAVQGPRLESCSRSALRRHAR